MKETDFPHLPSEVRDALNDYDHKRATGELTYDGEKDVDVDGVPVTDRMGGWLQSWLAAHLPVFDSGEIQ